MRRRCGQRSGCLAFGALAATIVVTLAAGLFEARNGENTQNFATTQDSLLAVAWLSLPAAGALLAWRRPGNVIGWLLSAAGVALALALAMHAWAVYAVITRDAGLPFGPVAAWVYSWLIVVPFGLGVFVVATFPDGRIHRRSLARFARLAVIALIVLMLSQALAPDDLDAVGPGAPAIRKPFGVEPLGTATSLTTSLAVAVLIAFGVAALVDLIARARHGSTEHRMQLRWPAAALCVIPSTMIPALIVKGPAQSVLIYGGQGLGVVALAGALSVAVLKYRLYQLGLFLRRVLTYAALTGCIVVVYIAVVTLVSLVFSRSGLLPSVIATALVAVAFGPLRHRLQAAVDRVLYGHRAEPYRVLADLGAGLANLTPTRTLPVIVESIGTSLKLPFVAVEVHGDGGVAVAARHGGASWPVVRLPIVHQHEHLGHLVVAPRSPEEPLSAAELRLLTEVARQAGVAVHDVRLAGAVQESRERAVRSREEERRRIRRDLHDGLGPALAGLALQLDTARTVVRTAPDQAEELLSALKGQLGDTVADVRRLVHDLRPPALDELGLLESLRQQTMALTGATNNKGPHMTTDLPPSLPELPAAIEVAAYRIAAEALTNVVRHARAENCCLRLRVLNRHLELEVVDDGLGPPTSDTAGMGLVSMRERAAEVGGRCVVEPGDPRGTRIHLRLPVTG